MNYPIAIVEDTLQKPGKHDNIAEFCAAHGIRLIRKRLICGDYTLPADQRLCIDTKAGMGEVYKNLVQDHDRVARECDRAHELGITLVFLVEDYEIESIDDVHKWVNPLFNKYEQLKKWHERGRYMGTPLPSKPPVPSDRLEKMMKTFAEHHHCEFRFCKPYDTGYKICEILLEGVAE